MAGLLGTTEAVLQRKTLFAQSNYGPVQQDGVITGGPYLRGQVLGLITANGQYTAYNNAAVDGTEVAAAVLIEDADGSVAVVNAEVGVVGVLIEANLIGLDAAGKVDLSAAGFFFK